MRSILNIGAGVLAAGLLGAGLAQAANEAVYTTVTSDDFTDVWSALKEAVLERGFVIDYEGNVGAMLERTAKVSAAGAEVPLVNARYLQFCASKLTHEAIAANVKNMAMCPLVVFSYQPRAASQRVVVGFRAVSGASGSASEHVLAKVNAMLKAVVDQAVE